MIKELVIESHDKFIKFEMDGCHVIYMKDGMEWTVSDFRCEGGRGKGRGRGKRLFIRSLNWINKLERRAQPIRIRLMPVAGKEGDQRTLNAYYEKMGFQWENEYKDYMFAMFATLLRNNVQQPQEN